MTALFEVTGLSGGYGPAPVLANIELQLAAGEIVALLGANGAGKTTLLRGLTGTLPTATGSVRLDGREISRVTTWRRVKAGLVHVPEGRHVFPAMTVAENLEVAALAAKRKVDLDDAYGLFPRLHERRGQRAGSLSGGEQQMLAIGRALLTDPKVILVDEMSAGLAPIVVQLLVDALATLRERRVALLLVEQSPTYIAGLIDRMYILDHGAIAGSGTLAELGGVDALARTYLGMTATV